MKFELEEHEKHRLAYTDAELYRMVVAKCIALGGFANKADFDAQVRKIGELEDCDRALAFYDSRPGCSALGTTDRSNPAISCKCGVSWTEGDANPPACKFSH